MKKLYFLNEDETHCYPESHFQDEMREQGLTEITVFEAIKSNDKEFIYCASVGECGESSDCGKQCDDYEPRNGKNGCCKYRRTPYNWGDEVTLKIKQVR